MQKRKKHQPLTDQQRTLAEHYLPFARKLTKTLKLLFPGWEDEFESAAYIALVRAAQYYDPNRNIKFATFAALKIRGALRDVGRSMSKGEDIVSLKSYSEENGQVLGAYAPECPETPFDIVDSVEAILKKLPVKNAIVCRLTYLHGKTRQEIAKYLCCSQAEVTRLHKQAINLLNDPYNIDGTIKICRRKSNACIEA